MTAYTQTTPLNPARWEPGLMTSVTSVYALTGAVVTADTFTFSGMFPGNSFQPIDVEVWGAELDTNASPTATIIVGNSDDDNGYVTSKTAGGAAQQFYVKGDGDLLGDTLTNTSVVVTLGGTVGTAASSGNIFVKTTYICNQA